MGCAEILSYTLTLPGSLTKIAIERIPITQELGGVDSHPDSERRLEGVHPIAVNPSTTLSAERMSLAGVPEDIVCTNVDT